jgi:hypothetical protein
MSGVTGIAVTAYFLANLCLLVYVWASGQLTESMTEVGNRMPVPREVLVVSVAFGCLTILAIGWPYQLYWYLQGSE